MDEVPAIIHRLSLRLWVPEYRAREDEELARTAGGAAADEQVTDPLASPPQDPVDAFGNSLDATQLASLSLESGSETHSLFSQKNLLRLAALTDSHRTLSLFTPSMRDVVFRAWAGPTERGEHPGLGFSTATLRPGISRKHSYTPSTSTTYTFSDGSEAGSHPQRPTLMSYGSSFAGHALGQSKHGKPGRKRKHRVVNLRKPKTDLDDLQSNSGESSMSATISSATSESGFPHSARLEREGELLTPPSSPQKQKSRVQRSPDNSDLQDTPPGMRDLTPRQPVRVEQKPLPSRFRGPPLDFQRPSSPLANSAEVPQEVSASKQTQSAGHPGEEAEAGPSIARDLSSPLLSSPFPYLESSPGGILEQAWMMKMAGEIARRVQDQKSADRSFWDRGDPEDTPPPAYGS